MRRRSFLVHIPGGMAIVSPFAFGQSPWPARPIRMIISSGAGSGVDRAGRLVADRMGKGLGQAMVAENKAGGQNVIGALAAARSPNDGYTIYLATAAALVTNKYLLKDLPYDPVHDFEPIGFLGYSPFALFVRSDSPIVNLQGFIDRAKAAPGKLSMANEGPKTFGGITSRLFSQGAGISVNMVAYPSAANGVQDVLGGHADSILCDVATAAPLTREGKLRMLAVTTANRLPEWDAPALAEAVPGFEMVGWFGLVAPRGTPAEIIKRLNAELDAALEDKAVREGLALVGFRTKGAGSPQEMASFVQAQNQRWAKISAEVGLLPE